MTMCPNTIRQRPAVACAHTLAQAWVPTTVSITAKTRLPPNNRMTSCKSSPNLAVPRALSSTTMKRTGISNNRQIPVLKEQSEVLINSDLALTFFRITTIFSAKERFIDHFLLQTPVYRPFSR